jgi:hypothetical protein
LIMMATAHLPEKTELLEPGVKISGFIKWSSKKTLSRWASALAVFSAIQPAEDSFYRFSRLQSNFAFSQMSPQRCSLFRAMLSPTRRGVAFRVVAPADIDAWNCFRS